MEHQEQTSPLFDSHYEFSGPISSMPSSSPLHAPSSTGSRKPKKPPPITPKRFTRFFTPRSSIHSSSRSISQGKSGRQLQEITRTALNRRNNVQAKTPRKTVNFADTMAVSEEQIRTPKLSNKKRKTAYLSPESSPIQPSPSKRARTSPLPFAILEDEEEHQKFLPEEPEEKVFPLPIRRTRTIGGTARTLQRSFGGVLNVGRGFARDHCTAWQEQTAHFYTGPEDFHALPPRAPPFCTASCNSMSFHVIPPLITKVT